jgi:hypothetical protein
MVLRIGEMLIGVVVVGIGLWYAVEAGRGSRGTAPAATPATPEPKRRRKRLA